jgi:hypothetical protein
LEYFSGGRDDHLMIRCDVFAFHGHLLAARHFHRQVIEEALSVTADMQPGPLRSRLVDRLNPGHRRSKARYICRGRMTIGFEITDRPCRFVAEQIGVGFCPMAIKHPSQSSVKCSPSSGFVIRTPVTPCS